MAVIETVVLFVGFSGSAGVGTQTFVIDGGLQSCPFKVRVACFPLSVTSNGDALVNESIIKVQLLLPSEHLPVARYKDLTPLSVAVIDVTV